MRASEVCPPPKAFVGLERRVAYGGSELLNLIPHPHKVGQLSRHKTNCTLHAPTVPVHDSPP